MINLSPDHEIFYDQCKFNPERNGHDFVSDRDLLTSFDHKRLNPAQQGFLGDCSLLQSEGIKAKRRYREVADKESLNSFDDANTVRETINLHKTVEHYFDAQVNATPNAPAISDGSTQLSYQELNVKANQAAHWLRERGIGPGDFVALLFEPSIEFIILVIATIKVGGIYTALDIQGPQKRLDYIINDFRPKIVISNRWDIGQHQFLHSPYCAWKDIVSQLDHYPLAFDSVKQKSESPVCLFYTSGTTGTPKGVLISHKAVVNLSKMANVCKVKPTDVVVQFYNLASDPFTMEVWDTLLNGAMFLIIPPRIKKNNQRFKTFLLQNNATNVILPTAYFHQLTRTAIDVLDALKTIVFGGEAMNIELIKNFLNYRKKAGLPVTLINAYGPTEATTVSCYKEFDLTTPESDLVGSIGRPINNAKTYVLDKNRQPVSAGEIGELYISGVNLAIGYLNSTALNNEKFTSNPFCKNSSFERMYKTGDLVKELPSGELEYVARIDDQVKISGYRVHLSEIESQLLKFPGISAAIVLAEKRKNNLHSLVAYVVASNQDIVVNTRDLTQFLRLSLPRYMLPKKFLKVGKIPLKSNGKVDKEQLKKVPYTVLSDAVSQQVIMEKEQNVLALGVRSMPERFLGIPFLVSSGTLTAGMLIIPTGVASVSYKARWNWYVNDTEREHYTNHAKR